MHIRTKRNCRIAACSLLLAQFVFGDYAIAHSEMDKPLYVATDGIDQGRCLDPVAPCSSIAYALGRVGKGGQILVAGGRYEIDDPADIFQLVGALVDARGGYDTADNFRRPTGAQTTLIGVPESYRAELGARGFHVISDRKGLQKGALAATEKMLAQQQLLQSGMASAPCDGGLVNGLPCENTELLSHVSFDGISADPGAAADLWGFVDLNSNREYAIVGYNKGTAVVDVTDPENPREVGFVDGLNATWRDIKVYQFFDATAERWQAYAYVTTDGASDGLFVIDLSELPQRIGRVSYESDFSAAHNVFATNTDYATGLSLTGSAPSLIIAGSNNGGGRFRLYSLATPASPGFVVLPNVSSNDYMHDAASMIIRDARKDTQCVNATDYCEVLFDFNESTVDIWDISNPASPVRLSRTPYSNSGYTHSGWPSEDGQYLFVHDELDEQSLGLQTTLRTFSLADLTAPLSIATWSGPTRAIDHNGFVRGNRYYMSNYSRGLTILDISDPASVQQAGLLDTYPFSDGANFVGAWGAYPYFPSGTVAVSDISSGLYLVGDKTLDSPQGQISFTQSSFGGAEGETIAIRAQRTGGASGSVSVELTIVPGTANASDLFSQAGVLSWADADSADKLITFTTAADGNAEGLERMLVKLVAPTGGATLVPDSIASVYIGDAGDAAFVEFDRREQNVDEQGFNTAVVVFRRRGSATGAVSVDFALTNATANAGSDYQGATSGTISWDDGDADPKWVELTIVDDVNVEPDEFIELSLATPVGAVIGTNALTRVTILDGTGANLAPNAATVSAQTVTSGSQVTLNGGASNDPDGDTLSYLWTQTLGPSVVISNAATATATFTAPTVSADATLQFQLQVSDPSGLSDATLTSVTVRPQIQNDSGGGGGGAFGGLLAMILAGWLLARRRSIRKDAA